MLDSSSFPRIFLYFVIRERSQEEIIINTNWLIIRTVSEQELKIFIVRTKLTIRTTIISALQIRIRGILLNKIKKFNEMKKSNI
jgi:hypothetical protein